MTSKHNKIGYNYPYGMIKHLLFILIVVLSSLQANAATKIGKIYYRLTGDSASVTYMAGSSKENANAYTGNIVIPSTVTYSGKTYRVIQIESSAFMGCNDLYSVDIPNSVKYMSGGSFSSGCKNLENIYISSSNPYFTKYDGCIYNADKTELVVAPRTKTSISFPSTIKKIGAAALAWSRVSSVKIPNSVTEIGNEAFIQCQSLTSVSLPSNLLRIGGDAFGMPNTPSAIPYLRNIYDNTRSNSVVYIGNIAFGYKGTKPTSLTLKEGTTIIADFAFIQLSSLQKVTLPSTLKSISASAFELCSSLTSVTIPDNCDKIGDEAFRSCKSLTTVKIGRGVKSIGYEAFAWDTSLREINIPDNCEKLDASFVGCEDLRTVTLGAGIKEMFSAFEYCPNITTIYCYAEKAPLAWNELDSNSQRRYKSDLEFDNAVYSNATLYIPYFSYKTYLYESDPWRKFTKKNYIQSTYIPDAKPEYVDFGLPSGTLWAKTNVGASSAEDFGKFYAWGETKTKSIYKDDNWYFENKSDYNYNNNSFKATMDLENDAAYVNWDKNWRIPTTEEWSELIRECTWKWTTQHGINGYNVSKNGKSIFLPAAGSIDDDYIHESHNKYLDYLTSDSWYKAMIVSKVDESKLNSVHDIFYGIGSYVGYPGYSIRAVSTKNDATKMLLIDEKANVNDIKSGYSTATIKRLFRYNRWDTFVLPFSMSNDLLRLKFGNSTEVAKLTGVVNNGNGSYTLNFETTTDGLEANVPVLIRNAKNTSDYVEYKIMNVKVENASPVSMVNKDINFVGTYNRMKAEPSDWILTSKANAEKAEGTEDIMPTYALLRAKNNSVNAKRITISIDGIATAIDELNLDAFVDTKSTDATYNIYGQKVGNNYKGVIIKGGKKYLKK